MLSKRIISCLDIRDGRTVKGVNFQAIRDAGDPVELARSYREQSIDELVFLDITATIQDRQALPLLVSRVAREIDIPFTVGGGARSREDARTLILAGADKVAINSAAVRRPALISELAQEFGRQCVVVAVDTKRDDDGTSRVWIEGGRTPTGRVTEDWAQEAQSRGAGEILLTSMDHDGTKTGFALGITSDLACSLKIPIIASGGAGKPEHFRDVFEEGRADAALAASVFHFGEIAVPSLKRFLKDQGVEVRI
jgi:cyclase